jgi:glycosyltransferase involved in cell wall biosynthesis
MTDNDRQPGISFVIRARNEAAALFDNFLSLRDVTVPHEIVVVLHRCTDESRRVADEWRKQGLPIRIFEDPTPISRAGYETLITPVFHPNSLPEFYNRAFGHARYRWLVKWDADFKATPYLLAFLKQIDIAETRPMSYQLACALGNTVVCHEEYMFNTWRGFGKYFCWENVRQDPARQSVRLEETCILSDEPAPVKAYWREPPWFLNPDTYDERLAEKYEYLVSMIGPEPPGFARSNNPDFNTHWDKLAACMAALEQYGIYCDK